MKRKREHDYWNIFIGGLLQDEYEPHGIFRLYDKVHSVCRNSYTEFHTWNENWFSLARKIYLISKLHKKEPYINVCAYSWGSWGLIQLCKHIGRFGFQVKTAILSDPVFKLKFFPALTLFSQNIYLPENIEEVYYLKQENKWPKGHNIYQTRLHDYEYIEPYFKVSDTKIVHENMDELEEFHKLVLEKFI